MMLNRLSQAMAHVLSFLRGLHLERFVGVALASVLLLTTNVNPPQNNPALGKAVRDRLHQLEPDSARPKTTGESEAEIYQDIPLNERLGNITRDSAEAFQELGDEYSHRAQQGGRAIRQGAERALTGTSD